MKFALIEFIDEFLAFEAFLAKRGLARKEIVIIALEPRVQAYLRKRDIQCHTTLPYFSTASHKKILVESEKIMEYLRSQFCFSDDSGLSTSYSTELTHHVRLYLNHLLKMLEILENACNDHPNCELFAWVDHKRSPSALIDDSERYVGALAEQFAKQRGLRFFNTNNRGCMNARKSAIKVPRIFARLSMKLTILLLRRRKTIFVPVGGGNFKSLLAKLAEKDASIVFLAIGSSSGTLKIAAFNILSLFMSLLKTRHYPYYLVDTEGLNRSGDRELARLMSSIDTVMRSSSPLFQYNGTDYTDLIIEKINMGLKGHLAAMLSWSHALRHLFGSFRDRMVLSFLALGIMSLAGELSKKLGITSLFVSHGAHPMPIDSYHEIELLNLCRGFMLSDYTHVALSTPNQENHLHYFKNKCSWVDNVEIITGPLIFADISGIDRSSAKIRLGLAPDDIVLTHATTTKSRHGERYYFLETFDELFASLSELINGLNGKMKLIIRIHPGFYLTDDEIRTLLPDSTRFIINRQSSFGDVLAATDILISYSSTAIDEALINRVPVLLFDLWNRYNHFGTEAYQGKLSRDIFPVCYVNDKTRLNEAIYDIMNAHFTKKSADEDFGKFRYSKDHRKAFFDVVAASLNTRKPQ